MANEVQQETFFEKNLKALKAKDPELVKKLEEHQPEDIEILQALSGDYVIAHKGIPLHSTENPVIEAEEIIDDTQKDYNNIQILFGLGLGYLFKRAVMDCSGIIIVYEPNIDVLRITLELVDFSEEIANEKVYLIDDLKHLRPIIAVSFYQGDTMHIHPLPAYRIVYPAELKELSTLVMDLYRDNYINQNTLRSKTRLWILESLSNLYDILLSPNIYGLKNKLHGVPAVAVSAGPSLEYAIEDLKKIQDKVFIIAVGQAMKSLDKAGIKPHIVCCLENLDVSQQFEGVESINDVILSIQPMTNRSLYLLPTKQLLINYPKNDPIGRWLFRTLGRDTSGPPNRGSVSFQAFYNALNVGANSIVLVGQDLAYRDGKCYADNTSYSDIKYTKNEDGTFDYSYNDDTYEKFGKSFGMTKEEFLRRKQTAKNHTVTTKGWNGETLVSQVGYAVFISNYVEVAQVEKPKFFPDVRIINSSVGGAYLEGFEHMSFQEALKEVDLDHGINIRQVIEDYIDDFEFTKVEYKAFSEEYKKTFKRLEKILEHSAISIEMANRIIKELDKKIVNKSYVDSLVKKLGKNDKKLIEYLKETELINPFVNDELFTYHSTYKRQKDTDDQVKNLKWNMEESIKLYDAAHRGSEQLMEHLSKTYEENNHILEDMFKE